MMQREATKRVLLGERQRLLSHVARLESELEWLENDVEPELVETAQQANIARLVARLDDRDRAELTAIERALVRLERGQYGTCWICGQAIPAERLRALPAAELCRPCAASREILSRSP
ncbi:MAG: TraR/DksA C4-type zinc finger protein [Candidatus Binatia bacterium]